MEYIKELLFAYYQFDYMIGMLFLFMIFFGGIVFFVVEQFSKEPKAAERTYNTLESTTDNTTIKLCGIAHMDKTWNEDKVFFEEQIIEHDVLLLEEGGYFDKIGEIGKKYGLLIFTIDHVREKQILPILKFTFLFQIVPYYSLLLMDLYDISEATINMWYMVLLPTLLCGSFTFIDLLNGVTGMKFLQLISLSYITGYRDYLMNKNLIKIIQKQTNKKILVIAGKSHTDYIENNFDTRRSRVMAALTNLKEAIIPVLFYAEERQQREANKQ